jgi:2-keto-4-pentenoate hydratase/2-oxohepta-3-ene-1,7-dioic acid hydratase in catechol pathway
VRIARIGALGKERAAVISGEKVIFVDSIISDWSRSELESGALQKVARADLSSLPTESLGASRIGAPIHNPTKVICVGLNYLGHIKEANAETPKEPIIFMKAPDSVVGPNDAIVIPPQSDATDYEVELAIGFARSSP